MILSSEVQDPKELKEKVKKLYQKHITAPVEAGGVEDGIQKEYHRQRDYLERTVLFTRTVPPLANPLACVRTARVVPASY